MFWCYVEFIFVLAYSGYGMQVIVRVQLVVGRVRQKISFETVRGVWDEPAAQSISPTAIILTTVTLKLRFSTTIGGGGGVLGSL